MEQKTKKEFSKLFWIFTIASLIGCIAETIFCIVREGQFKIRQGVIYGPFIPVYGAGAVIFYLLIPKITGATPNNTRQISCIKIFLYTMFLGGMTEYLFSYLQECIFGTVSWEYGNMLFNLNGRTSLIYSFVWGMAGIVFIKVLYPYTKKLDEFNYMNKNIKIMTTVFMVFMIFNIVISSLAGIRQYERTQNKQASTKLEKFLDAHYPDNIMDMIFSNKQDKEHLQRKPKQGGVSIIERLNKIRNKGESK